MYANANEIVGLGSPKTAAEGIKMPEIAAQQRSLDQGLKRLEEAAGNLIARLEGVVLVPVMPDVAGKGLHAAPPPCQTGLGQSLGEFESRVSGVFLRLENAAHRLEI